MKKTKSKTRKKSVFVMAMMILFATFTVKAADQTVSIDGLTKVDAITTTVQAAIDAAEGSGTVTVTGTGTSYTV